MELKPENGMPTPALWPEFEDGGSDGEIDLTLSLSIGRRNRRSSTAFPIRSSWEAHKDAAFLEDRGPMDSKMLESKATDRLAKEAEEDGGGRCAAVVSQVMYPYLAQQQAQYVPVENEFGFPCLIYCWAPTMSAAAGAQPVAFGRLPVHVSTMSAGGGCIVLPTEASGGSVVQPAESPGSITSGISDHRSVSFPGENASSSDSVDSMRSPTSNLISKKAEPQPRRQLSKPENEPSSTPTKKFRLASAVEEAKTCTAASDMNNKSMAGSGKGAVVEVPRELSSSRMPRVSTTGIGPNGRTVTGLLYKYDSSGVVIVCTCHGSSFTPAGFVSHAGGVNVAHPLKHIVMVSSPSNSSS